jgi:hypothetical protein
MYAGASTGANNINKVIYRTFVNCDDAGIPYRCCARACNEQVLWDCYYCESHLARRCGVRIGNSSISHAGKGLFATRAHREGSVVAHYGGEVVSNEELANRYCWMRDDTNEFVRVTAPYAMAIDADDDNANSLDSIRIRGAASYVNDARGSGLEENVELEGDFIRALKPIRAGDELFTDYGEEYWSCIGGIGKLETYVVENDCILDDNVRDVPGKRRRIL